MAEMMSSGIELMFAGMGIVFLFLAMLVVAINFMSVLVLRFFPDAPIPEVSASPKAANGIDKSVIAAITAAVHQHRSKYKS